MLLDYVEYDGVEIANASRAFAYARNHSLGWLSPEIISCPTLPATLGHGQYTTPAADGAPWYDPADPDTADFCGMVITRFDGLGDSTHEAQAVESIFDGGMVHPPRHASRTAVAEALLIGRTEAAVNAGLSWLESLLHDGDPCTPQVSSTDHPDMEFYSSCPTGDGYRQTMFDAHLVRGPLILERPEMSCGAMARITFTITSHNAYLYGEPLVITDQLSQFDYAFLASTYATYAEVAGAAATYEGFVQVLWEQYLGDQWGGAVVGGGSAFVEELPSSFYDPDCSPLPSFPTVPQALDTCRDLSGVTWQRAAFVVSRDDVPLWVPSLPRMTLTADTVEHKDIRVRFTPGSGDPDTDYILEWDISYLPAQGTLTLCGPKNRIDLTSEGVTARASHLVRTTSSVRGLRFPLIRCGTSYQVTVDVRSDEMQSDVSVGMSLYRRDY